uniref:Uncharacterized protein n=1 Tax=Arundo donax TaxID=35708 RepID=A0A0A8ZKA9_ARUDO
MIKCEVISDSIRQAKESKDQLCLIRITRDCEMGGQVIKKLAQ